MKVKEIKKLLANVDDELEVYASVSLDDITYTGQISSGDLVRIDDESNIFYDDEEYEDEEEEEDIKSLPLVFELSAFVSE